MLFSITPEIILRERNQEDETTRRIKSELLCQIEGLKNEIDDEPFILACTNCPWDIDTAVLRRFSRRIFVDLPDTQEAIRLLKNLLDFSEITESDWSSVESLLVGYSGADLVNVANFVKQRPITEILKAESFQFQHNGKLRVKIRDHGNRSKRPNEQSNDFPTIDSKWDDLPNHTLESRPINIHDLREGFREIKPTITTELSEKYASFR